MNKNLWQSVPMSSDDDWSLNSFQRRAHGVCRVCPGTPKCL